MKRFILLAVVVAAAILLSGCAGSELRQDSRSWSRGVGGIFETKRFHVIVQEDQQEKYNDLAKWCEVTFFEGAARSVDLMGWDDKPYFREGMLSTEVRAVIFPPGKTGADYDRTKKAFRDDAGKREDKVSEEETPKGFKKKEEESTEQKGSKDERAASPPAALFL